jgi:hypothetical protein
MTEIKRNVGHEVAQLSCRSILLKLPELPKLLTEVIFKPRWNTPKLHLHPLDLSKIRIPDGLSNQQRGEHVRNIESHRRGTDVLSIVSGQLLNRQLYLATVA